MSAGGVPGQDVRCEGLVNLVELLVSTVVDYAIFVLDLKLVKWEKVEHTPEPTHEPVVAS